MTWLLDGGVLLSYFITVIGIGLYKGRGDKTMEGFAVGNRNIPWWAVLASILAAEISAATFLGAPDEGYALRNYTYAQLAVGTLLARVIVALVFIKPYYDFRVVSIYVSAWVDSSIPNLPGDLDGVQGSSPYSHYISGADRRVCAR
jgi:SSS family solute:Na+ symporter